MYYNPVKIIAPNNVITLDRASSGGYQVYEKTDNSVKFNEDELNEMIGAIIAAKKAVNVDCFYLADRDFAAFNIKTEPYTTKGGKQTTIATGTINASNFKKLVETRDVTLETKFIGRIPKPQLVFRSKGAAKVRTAKPDPMRIGK